MEQTSMFYIPIYHLTITNWKMKKEKLLAIARDIKNVDHVTTDFFSGTIRDKENTNEFASIMFDELEKFKGFSGINNYVVKETWIQISERGDHHPVHSHGALGFSSVIFLDYDPAVHSSTQFFSPFKNFITGCDLFYTPQNIVEGSMIFFPSAIGHFATPNTSDKVRKIISCNLIVE